MVVWLCVVCVSGSVHARVCVRLCVSAFVSYVCNIVCVCVCCVQICARVSCACAPFHRFAYLCLIDLRGPITWSCCPL